MIASRHGGACAKYRGTLVLIEGCAVQMAGLAALVMAIEWIDTPPAPGRKRRECEPGPILLCMGLFSRFCVWPLRCAAEEYLHCVRDTKSLALRANGYSIRLPPIPLQGLVMAPLSSAVSNQSSRLALLAACALLALSIIACAAFLTGMRRVTA